MKDKFIEIIEKYYVREELPFENLSGEMLKEFASSTGTPLAFIGYSNVKNNNIFSAHYLETEKGRTRIKPLPLMRRHISKIFTIIGGVKIIENFDKSEYAGHLPKKHRKIKRLLFYPVSDGENISLIMLANKKTPYGPADLEKARNCSLLYHSCAKEKFIKQQLRENEKKFIEYSDRIDSILLVLDGEGKISYINEFGARFLGMRKETLIGMDWFSEFIPKNREEEIKKVFSEVKHKNSEYSIYKNPVIAAGGKEKPVLWKNYKIGEREIFSIGKPVSKNDYENRIYTQYKEFEQILNSSQDIIYMLDERGKILFINEAVTWLGYRPDEITGRNISDLVHPEEKERIKSALSQFFRTGRTPDFFKFSLLDKYRRKTIIENKSSFFRNETLGKNVLICFGRDITELEETESEFAHKEKMETLGNMASHLAHDFNNILGGMEGYLSVIMTYVDKKSPFYSDLLGLKQAIEQGSKLTKEIMSFARKPAGEEKIIEPRKFLMKEKKLWQSLLSKKIKLSLSFEKDLPEIRMNPANFSRLMLNLATNARDAIIESGKKDGLIKITVASESAENIPSLPLEKSNARNWLKISVKDNGTGMKKEIISRIFEPFFTTKPKGKGTGFGLAIIYSIVRSQKGQIKVKSREGEGSEFIVFLPERGEGTEKIQKPVLEKPKSAVKNILLIEDDNNLLGSTKKGLELLNYKVFPAENFKKAENIFRKNRDIIDLVFSDIVLPDGNGFELCEKFTREKPGLKIILTSGFIEDEKLLNKISGRFAFMEKPYTLDEFVKTAESI